MVFPPPSKPTGPHRQARPLSFKPLERESTPAGIGFAFKSNRCRFAIGSGLVKPRRGFKHQSFARDHEQFRAQIAMGNVLRSCSARAALESLSRCALRSAGLTRSAPPKRGRAFSASTRGWAFTAQHRARESALISGSYLLSFREIAAIAQRCSMRRKSFTFQKVIDGGQGVNRTLDTKIFSLLLYRLSYLPTGTAGVGPLRRS
jgi:hypothetical protein